MHVHIHDPQGSTIRAQASTGDTLMRAALAAGVTGIIAECGGSLACATCHVYVDAEWIERLAAPSPEEEEMLDCVSERRPGSRLSCQIALADPLDGLSVTIPETQY